MLGMITARQIRAARGEVALTAEDLAKFAECSRDTTRRFEAGGAHQPRSATEAAIPAALEERGSGFAFSRDGEPIGIEGKP